MSSAYSSSDMVLDSSKLAQQALDEGCCLSLCSGKTRLEQLQQLAAQNCVKKSIHPMVTHEKQLDS